MTWNVWRFWELTLHKYLKNISLSRKFTLHTSTLLSISGHFKRFQLNHPPSQVTKFVNSVFYELPAPAEFFSFLRACILPQFLTLDILGYIVSPTYLIRCCNCTPFNLVLKIALWFISILNATHKKKYCVSRY